MLNLLTLRTYFITYLITYLLLTYLSTYLLYLLIYFLTCLFNLFTYFTYFIYLLYLLALFTYLLYYLFYLFNYLPTSYLFTYFLTYFPTYLLTLLACLFVLLALLACLRSKPVFSQSINSPQFMEPDVSLPQSQVPAPIPILSQINPVHVLISHFLKMCLNIILPSTPGTSKWSLSFRFPYQTTVYGSPLPHTRYMPRPSLSSRFYYPNDVGWGVQIINLLAPELFF